MADEANPPKILLPRLRVPSLSFTDLSHSGISNSLRNISSSTSLLSTPSNNIRRVQQINGHKATHNRPRKTAPSITKGSSKTSATRKLLNLQELKRSLSVVRPFVLRKPADLTKYDYSVYSHKVEPPNEVQSAEKLPLVRESQIRAWESAEKISSNTIFDTETMTGDNVGIFEDFNTSMEVPNSDDDLSFEACFSDNAPDMAIVRSIPDYTKGELKIILDYFDKLQSCDSKVDNFIYEEAEKNALGIYREQQRIVHERAFKSNPKPLAKRKLQVFRKKELLHRLFGYLNNINHSHITNNTSYSAFDNVLNASKALQEDHDETICLLKLEDEYVLAQSQIAEKIQTEKDHPRKNNFGSNGMFEPMLKNQELLDFSSSWLTASYDKQLGSGFGNERLDDSDQNSEILSYTMGYLKACVRE